MPSSGLLSQCQQRDRTYTYCPPRVVGEAGVSVCLFVVDAVAFVPGELADCDAVGAGSFSTMPSQAAVRLWYQSGCDGAPADTGRRTAAAFRAEATEELNHLLWRQVRQ